MRKDQPQYDAMKEKHIDDMIQLALEAIDAEEAEQIEETTFDHEDEEGYKAAYASFLNKLEKEEKENERQKKKESRNGRLRIAAEIAAGIVITAGLAGAYAVTNVEAVRTRVMQMLIEIQNDHADVSFVEDQNAGLLVPEGWKGLYYVSYVPEGFSFADMSKFISKVHFVNKEGAQLYFGEYDQSLGVSLDTEDAQITNALINGNSALCVEKGQWTSVAWSVEDRYFVIEGDIPLEEALRMADGVKRIVQ